MKRLIVVLTLCCVLAFFYASFTNKPTLEEVVNAAEAGQTAFQASHVPTCGRGAPICADCSVNTPCSAEGKCLTQTINFKVQGDTETHKLYWYWEAYAHACMNSHYYPHASGQISCRKADGSYCGTHYGDFKPGDNPIPQQNTPIHRTTINTTATIFKGGGTDSNAYDIFVGALIAGHTPKLRLQVCIDHALCDSCEPGIDSGTTFTLGMSNILWTGPGIQ